MFTSPQLKAAILQYQDQYPMTVLLLFISYSFSIVSYFQYRWQKIKFADDVMRLN